MVSQLKKKRGLMALWGVTGLKIPESRIKTSSF